MQFPVEVTPSANFMSFSAVANKIFAKPLENFRVAKKKQPIDLFNETMREVFW